jgi:hypothetical protein
LVSLTGITGEIYHGFSRMGTDWILPALERNASKRLAGSTSAAKQAAEKVENREELHPSGAEARSVFNRLRRGWKPRPFKEGGG